MCECEHCTNWDDCVKNNQQKCIGNRCMNVNNGEEVNCNNFKEFVGCTKKYQVIS